MRVVSSLLLALGLLIGSNAISNAGTFYNPIGDRGLTEKGAEAAALLNEAQAAVFNMYAAFERKKAGEFEEHRKRALNLIEQSLGLFRAVSEIAGEKPISLKGRTDSEQKTISRFLNETLLEYKIAAPKTQKDLANVAVIVIENFQDVLLKSKFDPRKGDLPSIWKIIRVQLRLGEIGLAASLIWYNSN